MRTLLTITMTLIFSSTLWASSPTKLGATGAQFLKIGVGSKYQGMAEASVATANDVYSMYWNPAGMADIEGWSVGFTSVNWLLDINLNYVGIARNFEDVGVFGASVTILSAGEQEITTINEQNGTGQNYTASSYAIGLTYATMLTNRFSFGGSVKYIGEEIGLVSSSGMAFDFGTLLYTGFKSLRLGMSITNMGPDLKFTGDGLKVPFDDQLGSGVNAPISAELSTTPYNLPLMFRVGLAYDMEVGPKSMLTLSSDFNHPSDNIQRGSIGAEFAYNEMFFLRGGYKIQYDEETLALGGGLITSVGGERMLIIDYSWQDFGRLEAAQRFSVGFTF